jgi:hypothetical protein
MKASRLLGKALLSLGVFVGLGAVPALAYADSDSYVEVQFDAGTMGDFMRRQLSTKSTFCPQPTVLDGDSAYVDHLEFNQAGTFSRASSSSRVLINDFTAVESHAVLYTQPVDVHLKTLKCAQDPDCWTTTPVTAELTYELYTNAASQLCMRSNGSRGLPERVTPPEVNVCLPFNADYALKTAGLSGQSTSGNAVSVDTSGKRVAVRIELGRTGTDYDSTRVRGWQAFVDGALEETGARGDWSVFVHKSLILGALQKRLSDAIATQAGFRIDGAIATSWDGGAAGARIDARLTGAFSTPLCPNEIHVNNIAVTGQVGPNSFESPTGLLTVGSVSYDVSVADAEACGLALFGPLGGLVFSSLADSIKLNLPSLGENCRADDDFNFSCNAPVFPQLNSVGPLQIAKSTLAGVVGSATGLAMNGSVKTMGSASLKADGWASSFRFDERAEAYQSSLALRGTGRVCDASFWAEGDGDVGLFTILRPSSNGIPTSYQVSLPRSQIDAYGRSPFRLMATVMTSAGVHTYPFELITAAQ